MKFYFSHTSPVNQTLSDEEIRRNALLDDLEKTKRALEIAYVGFDNVTEPELIDCYIYELNSVLKRYNFILEQIGKLLPVPETLPERTWETVSRSDTETPVSALIG